jgi:LacI family transcriptional regulator
VDGFFVSLSSETKNFEHFKKIQEKNIPMVIFDRVTPEINAPGVRIDNEGGGFQATEHLIEQGYKRIAVLAGPKNLDISNKRLDGYVAALKKHHIKVDPELIIYCDFNQDYAFFATEELLAMKKRPDAIFTISDRMAIGAMLSIKKRGLKMPQDIGLVGFNDEPVMRLMSPAISSVEQPSFELGKATAKLFIETMHNAEDMHTEDRILKTKLHIRESSSRITVKNKR